MFVRRIFQSATIAVLRPYVSRELPGWGHIYNMLADYRRDAWWQGAPTLRARNRLTGYITEQDISKWPDRSTYFLGRWHDLELQSFAASILAPGDTVIDVGANRGEFSLYASSLVPKGNVIAFEPNPECVNKLRSDIERNKITNVIVHQCGLADTKQELLLRIPQHNSGEASFRTAARGSEHYAIINRGDDLLADYRPRLIKIDVEGFETKTVRGLCKTIIRCKPIVVTEVIRRHLEASDSSPEELSKIITGLGYTGFRLQLSKHRGKYSHVLGRLNLAEPSFDAVWLPV